MKTVGEYDLQSLQIYFDGSLEIQEELIRLGFCVPLVTTKLEYRSEVCLNQRLYIQIDMEKLLWRWAGLSLQTDLILSDRCGENYDQILCWC